MLKEASDALYVDLGFDVVRVPTAMINKRTHKADRRRRRQRVGGGLLSDRPPAGADGERAGSDLRGRGRAGADSGRAGVGVHHQFRAATASRTTT